ncbi:cytochrome bd-I ubiquinol oxidase subunit 1 apoprotein [Desulfonauticus submarinus]|uniref:Cytochrome bd-I ubiquinol oxidase subunit 1 apoprotein n=1 Tax=Desulfonauticus submarinus TaxID=206665 RepID=A0A1G9ZIN3_9BACT|nr:cytochrome c3 family protein [Desulfonauticus submarinus]SDN21322.1 cytochrome bd-I ubiquinol oxidase subunit 1 apoprotein [Desulfonauticus submarinus]
MQYPVWELTFWGGGLTIALLAIFHVYIAHFAVGGGLFLVLTEQKARSLNSKGLLEYLKKHSLFFLLVSMVAGGVTGVGIWFNISLIQPQATSVLIHNFVFLWAIEWLFFLGEIVALLLYYYGFERLSPKNHTIIGWLYFAFAWGSLFIITGIIDFMLTPGKWIVTGNVWDGYFNPSFLPSLFFRTFLAFSVAALFGLVTACFIKDEKDRNAIIKFYVKYLNICLILTFFFGLWYYNILSPLIKTYIFKMTPFYQVYLKTFIYLTPVLMFLGLFMLLKLDINFKRLISFILLIFGILYFGSFEFLREGARKPFVIYNYMYSNSIKPEQVQKINEKGLLKVAKWSRIKEIVPENELKAGKEIFNLECLSCHSIGGWLRDILRLTKKYDVRGLEAQLSGQGKILKYMPPFVGTAKEKQALAKYIIYELQGKKGLDTISYTPPNLKFSMPTFNIEKDEYVLLAWNNMGMHCISDCSSFWVILPPANDLYAQLLKRGETPEIITEGITICYKVEKDFLHPENKIKLWANIKSIFGKDLKPGVGLSGNRVFGKMKLEEEKNLFVADLIPVVPYPESGGFNPYPLVSVEAVDNLTGKVLASTKAVLPTSTEMGCKNCHGGPWKVGGVAGISDITAEDVLKVHDRINRTNLLENAKKGRPVLCQSCHPDPVVGAKGKPGIPSMSAALHGWHASYLSGRGADACSMCHPASATGPTGCLRGVHQARGLSCIDCHGYIEDHALSLLKYELKKGKPVQKLITPLTPRTVSNFKQIVARVPWENEPTCESCHNDAKHVGRSSFNMWTKDGGELYRNSLDATEGLMCASCHNSPHAIYPAMNAYGKDRDNIQPIQYQKMRVSIGAKNNCKVCHKVDMEEDAHH